MKQSVSLLIILFFAFSCKQTQQIQKSDLVSENLKGNVWKIEKTIHTTGNKCGCVLNDECNKSKKIYDNKGNLLTLYTIDEFGNTNDSTDYIYNRKGVCSEIIRFNGKNMVEREVPVLKNNKITGYKIYNESGTIEATLNYLYSGDEIAEEKTLNSKGEIVSFFLKEYNNGQLVSQTEKNGNGEILSVSRFIRNENNDIIERIVFVSRDNTEYKFKYEYVYDNTGNWIQQTRLYNGQIENIVIRNIEYFTV
jgi:hypothetical protein